MTIFTNHDYWKKRVKPRPACMHKCTRVIKCVKWIINLFYYLGMVKILWSNLKILETIMPSDFWRNIEIPIVPSMTIFKELLPWLLLDFWPHWEPQIQSYPTIHSSSKVRAKQPLESVSSRNPRNFKKIKGKKPCVMKWSNNSNFTDFFKQNHEFFGSLLLGDYNVFLFQAI